MHLVLELPAEGLPRRRWGQAEQDAAVHLEAARADRAEIGEELRADTVILLADRQRVADGPDNAVGLEAGLDHGTKRQPRFPSVLEIEMSVRVGAEVLLEENIDRVDGVKEFLAQGRPKRRLVRIAAQQRLAVFPEEAVIEPILSGFAEHELVFGRQLIELEVVAGAGLAVGFELQLGVPPIVDAIPQLVHEALLVVGAGVAAAAVGADLLELELAGLGIGQMHFEIGERRRGYTRRYQQTQQSPT